MNVKRLRQLQRLLERIPREKFIMRHWYRDSNGNLSCKSSKNNVKDMLHECGTAACAAGYASIYRPFVIAAKKQFKWMEMPTVSAGLACSATDGGEHGARG